jgi:hypothetical protein
MILTSKVLEALNRAAERDDGKCYQGWMTKDEFAACVAEGYVQLDFARSTRERAELAAQIRGHIVAAKKALHEGEPEDWRLALDHLCRARRLEEVRGERWWFLTEKGYDVVDEAFPCAEREDTHAKQDPNP